MPSPIMATTPKTYSASTPYPNRLILAFFLVLIAMFAHRPGRSALVSWRGLTGVYDVGGHQGARVLFFFADRAWRRVDRQRGCQPLPFRLGAGQPEAQP